ncbi:MAG TPA: hypothetical protein DHW42_02715 [Candidatus Marinimicrobia bacterium]|nr:hypothetical protein [Candidatus Neomarinimicrobiota bacterium]
MKKYIIVFILFSFLGCGNEQKPLDYIARVNDTYLTKEDLAKMLPNIDNSKFTDVEQLKSIISSWVKNEILYQNAKKYHFDKNESISYKVNNYKKSLIVDSYIQFLLQSNVTVSDTEIRDYYINNRKSFMRNTDEAKVTHVVLADFEEANKIKYILLSRNAREIDKLFSKYIFETKTVRKGESLKEIDKNIFESRPRNIIGPIPSDYGYHVIEVLSRFKKGSVRQIDDVRDEILQRITQTKIQFYHNNLLDSLLLSTNFDIKQENITDWKTTL